MAATLAFAFVAGVLSTLSPCVLPLLPIILAGASARGRLGIVWLASGLAISFTAIGLFLATVGFSIGLNPDWVRGSGALLLTAFGIILMVPALHARTATAMGPVSNWTEQKFGGFATDSSAGQFGLGLLLGAVWGPCVGPTLGATSVMAAQGENLGSVAATMLLFGIGASLPLLALGALSRSRFIALRERIYAASSTAKFMFGATLMFVGLLVMSGADKKLEAALVQAMPLWLVKLSTSF